MSESPGVIAYIGLGSNLDDPLAQVERALVELSQLAQTRCLAHSHLYRSAPLGPPGQPDYINAVAKLETQLPPHDLLDALQGLESDHRRDRTAPRWGPRTLDLDLLLYGRMQIDDERLEVPHPRMTQRTFVLLPLADLASPQMRIPGARPLTELLARLSPEGIERVA